MHNRYQLRIKKDEEKNLIKVDIVENPLDVWEAIIAGALSIGLIWYAYIKLF